MKVRLLFLFYAFLCLRDAEAQIISLNSAVHSIVFFDDGSFACATDSEGIVFRAADGAPGRRALLGHEGAVRSLALHPRTGKLASVGDDRTLRLWDHNQGVEERRVSLAGRGVQIAFSLRGTFLTVVTEKGIQVWRNDDTKLVEVELQSPQVASAVCFNPVSDAELAIGTSNGTTEILDLDPPRRLALLSAPDADPETDLRVATVCYSSNGKLIASAIAKHELMVLYQRDTGAQLRSIRRLATACTFVGNSDLAIGKLSGEIEFWAVPDGRLIQRLRLHRTPVNVLVPRRSNLVSGDERGGITFGPLPFRE